MEPTKKQLQDALDLEAKARAEANAKAEEYRVRNERQTSTINDQSQKLNEQYERNDKLALALSYRPAMLWLQAVAIVLIVVGIALSVASWKAQRSIKEDAVEAIWDAARGHTASGNWKVDTQEGGEKYDPSLSLPCSNAEARWKARDDGNCYAEDAPSIVTTGTAAAATTALPDGVTVPIKGSVSAGKHALELSISEACWLRVSEITPAAKLLIDGQKAADYKRTFSFDEKTTLEVRAGCPGAVHYKVNGKDFSPTNASKTPEKSEVVEILL